MKYSLEDEEILEKCINELIKQEFTSNKNVHAILSEEKENIILSESDNWQKTLENHIREKIVSDKVLKL